MKYLSLLLFSILSGVLIASEFPDGYKLPGNPLPGVGENCSSCTAKSSASTTSNVSRLPLLSYSGEFIMKIVLAPSPFIDATGLLSMIFGQGITYQPGSFYTIIPPGDSRGDSNYVIVREGAKKIIFRLENGNWGNGELTSPNTPGVILFRDGMNIKLRKLISHLDYLYESPDFGSSWRLAEIRRTDAPELTLKCIYDQKTSLLKTISLPANIAYELEYNKDLTVKQLTASDGSEFTKFAYNNMGILNSVSTYISSSHPLYSMTNTKAPKNKKPKDELIREYTAEFDNSGKMLSVVDQDGKKYKAEYMHDTDNKKGTSTFSAVMSSPDGIKSFVERINNTKEQTSTIFAGKIYPGKEKEPEQHHIERQLNLKRVRETNVLVSRIIDGRETVYNYDKNAPLTVQNEMIDSEGNVTSFEFNEHGLLLKRSYQDETAETFEYNPTGRPTLKTYRDGSSESFIYDKNGRLLKKTDSFGVEHGYLYNQDGTPLRIIDSDGNNEDFEWDKHLRLVKHTRKDGISIQWTYHGILNLPFSKAIVPADGDMKKSYTLSYSYDPSGRLLAVNYPDKTFENWKYNCCDIVEYIDRAGNKTRYAYDNFGRLTLETSPFNEKTVHTYDTMSRIIKTLYPDKRFEEMTYEGFSQRLSGKTFVDGTKVTYEYNSDKKRVKEVYSDKRYTEYEYDKKGRTIAIKGTKVNNMGYVYDDKGNLLAELNYGLPRDSKNRQTSYEYDNKGRLLRITMPDGTIRENIHSTMLPDDLQIGKNDLK